MKDVVISGSGLYTPPNAISNDQLVESFNAWVQLENKRRTIEASVSNEEPELLQESSSAFIEKASGIRSRYVMDAEGILDPLNMCPRLPERPDDQPSLQCEMALHAARGALSQAMLEPGQLDGVIVAFSNLQRAYPAMAVELQFWLGAGGFGYDMNVACSSATFGIQAAYDAIRSGSAQRVLVVNPEICSGHLNFRDRDSHFIFGDACTAVVVEAGSLAEQRVAGNNCFRILGTKLWTGYSNNIRNNFGFLNRAASENRDQPDKLFMQNGRKVFKDVCPKVAEHIAEHLSALELTPAQLKRLWLHQANLNMNKLVAKKVLGHDPDHSGAPVILDEYANTSSAGSIIAFHKHSLDFSAGEKGVVCSFGAGYSVGSVILEKV